MKRTIINLFILCCLCGLLSCNTAYHKETDEMIAKCEQSVKSRNLNECQTTINIINNRELTQKQSDQVKQLEIQIIELNEQIKKEEEQRRLEAARKAEEERIARIEAFKRKIAGTYHFTGFSYFSYKHYYGMGTWFDHESRWDVDITVQSDGSVYYKKSTSKEYDKNGYYIGQDSFVPSSELIGEIQILDENTFTINSNNKYRETLFTLSTTHDGHGNMKYSGEYKLGQCVFDFNGRKLYQSPYSSEYIEFTFKQN